MYFQRIHSGDMRSNNLLLSAVDLRNETLKETDLKELELKDFSTTKVNDVQELNVTVPSLSFLALFHETGVVSKQPYQPKTNHRMLKYNVLNEYHMDDETNKRHPPMMQSTIVSTDILSFSTGNPIGLMYYEVEYDKTGEAIIGHGLVSRDSDGERALRRATSKGTTAKVLTGRSFKRMLNLFGMEMSKVSDEETVTMAMWGSFFIEIGDFDTSTEEKFKKKLSDLKMDRWFTYDSKATLEANFDHLGQCFRCLQGSRLGEYDGQHRVRSGCFAAIGFYYPQNTLQDCEDERMTFEMFKKSKDKNFEIPENHTLEKGQVYAPLTAKIGCILEAESMSDSLANLRRSGDLTIGNASTVVKGTVAAAIVDIVTALLERARELTNMSRDSIWERSMKNEHEAKYAVIANAVRDYFAVGTRKMVLESSQVNTTQIDAKLLNLDNELRKLKTGMVSKQGDRYNAGGLPKHIAHTMHLVKVCARTERGINNLMKFFSHERPEAPQFGEDVQVKIAGIDFIESVVNQAVLCSINMVAGKVWTELKAMKEARFQNVKNVTAETSNPYEHVVNDIEGRDLQSGDFFINLSMKGGEAVPKVIKQGTLFSSLSASSQSLPTNSSNFTQKVGEVITVELYDDVLDTVVKHGMNPKLKHHKFKDNPSEGTAEQEEEEDIIYNDCVRAYFMDAENVDWEHKLVPTFEFRDEWSANKPFREKTMMNLLFVLWLDYLQVSMTEEQHMLTMMTKFCKPNFGKYLRGNEKSTYMKWSQGTQGTVDSECPGKAFHGQNGVYIIAEKYLFSTFAKAVLEDEVDVDNSTHFVRFQKHMTKYGWRSGQIKGLSGLREKKIPVTSPVIVKKKRRTSRSSTPNKKDVPEAEDGK